VKSVALFPVINLKSEALAWERSRLGRL